MTMQTVTDYRPTDTYDQPATVNALVTDVDGDRIRIEYRGNRTWASVVCVQGADHAAAVSLNKRGMAKAIAAMQAAHDAMPDDGIDCDAEED